MWKPVLGAALFALTATAAHANGAVCRTGQGCTCLNMDAGLLPVLMGSETLGDMTLPETIVVDRSTNTTFRTRRSAQEVHQSYGGSGECPVDDGPAELVPLDGTWQWRTRNETATGCPPMMAGMLAASRTETLNARVAWDGRFHPQRLAASLPQPEMSQMSPYIWRELSSNRWLSDNIRERTCEDGTCVDVALSLSMNLVAADRITGLLTLRTRVEGGQSAVLASFGMADCRVRVSYEIVHLGP